MGDITLLPGDVLAVHGSSVITLGIEIITDSPISHVALVYDVPSQMCIEANGFRTVGDEPMATYRGRSLVMRDTSISDAQRDALVAFAKSKYGIRYDYGAIRKEFERYEFHVNIDPNEHGLYICSTLVAAAYLSIGDQLTDVPLASPDDIYKSKRLTIIGRY